MSSIEADNLTKQCGNFFALSGLNLKNEITKCVDFLGTKGACEGITS
jgi:ABC-type multidrug transport system ATPase subunit